MIGFDSELKSLTDLKNTNPIMACTLLLFALMQRALVILKSVPFNWLVMVTH
jgi:hypothetical protein